MSLTIRITVLLGLHLDLINCTLADLRHATTLLQRPPFPSR